MKGMVELTEGCGKAATPLPELHKEVLSCDYIEEFTFSESVDDIIQQDTSITNGMEGRFSL